MEDSEIEVKGVKVDEEARCLHYHKEIDVIAIQFACCNEFYACYHCHKEEADHSAKRWPKTKWSQKAILCGHCKKTMTIFDYMQTNMCPDCKHPLNEKCLGHYPLYFEV